MQRGDSGAGSAGESPAATDAQQGAGGRRTAGEEDTLIKTTHAHFSASALLVQFAVHVTLPFSVPVYLACLGAERAAKQDLLPTSVGSALLTYIVPSMLWVCVALFFRFPDEMRRDNVDMLQVVALVLLHCVRAGMIACKYGSLRRDEYHRFMNVGSVEQAKEWRDEVQLISGWMYPKPFIIYEQLKMAAALHDLDLRHAYFAIKLDDTSVGNWREYLSGVGLSKEVHQRFADDWPNYEVPAGTHAPDPDAISSVPAFHVLLSIIFRSLATSGTVTQLCMLMAALRCVLPCISAHILDRDRIAPETVVGILFFGFQCIQTFILYFFVLMLMQVAVMHYQRQYLALLTLGALARNHPDEYAGTPMLDMKTPMNIRAWTFLRIALQHVGTRYAHRIKIYTAGGFVFLLAIVCVAVGSVAAADDSAAAMHNPYMYYCLQDLFTMGLMLSVSTYFGGEANMQYYTHKAYLTRHIKEARQAGLSSKNGQLCGETNKERVAEYLETTIRQLKGLDDAYFITVLGVRAEPALASTFLTAFGSVFVLLVSQYVFV